MVKYEASFKLEVVQRYLSGADGYKAVAQLFNLNHGMVRRWVERYRAHGISGLRKKHSHYSAEFKWQLLRQMWDEQLSYSQVLVLYDLRVSTDVIRAWERRYHEGGVDALASRPKGRPKKMPKTPPPKPEEQRAAEQRSREELLEENAYLRTEVAYLKKLRALVQAKEQAARKKHG